MADRKNRSKRDALPEVGPAKLPADARLADPPPAREIVCRLPTIYKWEGEAQTARSIVGADTTSFAETKIYFTARRDFVYAHSNFVNGGYECPTKILTKTSKRRPLDEHVINLVTTEEDFASSRYFYHDVYQAMSEEMKYYVDERLLSDPQYSFLDFSRLKHAFVVTSKGFVSLEQWSAERSASTASDKLSKNPWVPGSFYLVALLSVLITLGVLVGLVSAFAIPVIIIGGLLSVAVIGAMTLRNLDLLKEKSFLQLMTLSFRYLPLLARTRKKNQAGKA